MATAWRTRSAERVRSGMRAVRLYGPRRLQTDDLPVPEPGVGEALVRVRAVGLCGSDLHYYCAGRIGLDPKTGKAPEKVEDEVKLLLDGEKEVLEKSGMTMDDLVYVQIACSDLSLYDKFNTVYKSYFTTKDYPAREFIGAGSLLRGGHFELQAIAVKR